MFENYYYFYYYNYFFVLLATIISLGAQIYVKNSYAKYSQLSNLNQITGAQVARSILDARELYDVKVIESRQGVLSDHYDPSTKTVALSPKVYHDASIASVAIAAHEVGHAIQHAENYHFISLRNKILPMAVVASKFSYFPIMLGFFAGIQPLMNFGIIMLSIIALFQLVTLPVEFDASNRALKNIQTQQYLTPSELKGSKTMLSAAALTYVAALMGTVLTIMRYISLSKDKNN